MLNPSQGNAVFNFIQADNKYPTVSQTANTEQRPFLPPGLRIKRHIHKYIFAKRL